MPARHVTLIRTPVVSSPGSFSAPVTPPVAVAYLAASLRAAGFDVAAIDALGEGIDQVLLYEEIPCRVRGLRIPEVIARIPAHTSLIGISCMFSQEWLFTRELVRAVARAFPGVPIVLGGEHPTAVPDFILRSTPEVTACAVGEGEATIVDLARHFPAAPEKVAGIVYRGPDGAPVRSGHRDRIRDVSSIPRPAWDLLPLEAYLSRPFASGTRAGRTMPILATRGCPYKCSFCSNAQMWTQRYFPRPPVEVVDEIEDYIRDYRVDSIEFYDLTAIVKKDWVIEFGRLLKERGLRISYSLPSGTRSEALDAEVTKVLAETGCRYLVYAAESGSPRILKYIRKQVKLPKMIESMRQAKKNGLSLRCNLMIGVPAETRRDAWRTLRFQTVLALIGVDDAPLYMFSPYPGSELYEELRRKGVIGELNDDYFRSLLCQMDLSTSSNYCENMGPRELAFYRFVGMSSFYALSYATRPWRVARSLLNIFVRGTTDTVFEQRLFERLRSTVRRAEPPPEVVESTPLPAEPAARR
jgi:anaerobic magnesium-protoporphyrin IX monomethyl ester cyclase